MTPRRRRDHETDTQSRLEQAERVAGDVEAQGETVRNQVSFAEKLAAGWRRVHERNNLARLFHEEGRI